MNRNILAVMLSGLLAASGAALADEHAMQRDAMPGNAKQGEAKQHHGAGKVNKVDMQKGVINLTHGPIRSLGWMGMTMDFKVKDKAMLEGIKAGQKVKFEVVKEGPGKFYIVHIEASK